MFPDILNSSEKELTTYLKTDQTLMVDVKQVHEKFIDDVNSYPAHQVPAVGVTCNRYDPGGPVVEGACEIVVQGTGESADALCKRITARVIDLLQIESDFSPPVLRLKGIVRSTARGEVNQVRDESYFLYIGIVEFELEYL